ncbi:hypothetical protein N5D_16150 [Enterococcus faecalis]|nr:hypothetical protein N5D_16150 [Enterococcus faecalis]
MLLSKHLKKKKKKKKKKFFKKKKKERQTEIPIDFCLSFFFYYNFASIAAFVAKSA